MGDAPAGTTVKPQTVETRYVWWSAAAVMFLYTAGYATVGFGLLFFAAVWWLGRRRSFPWRATPLDPPLAVFGVVLMISALVSPYRSIALVVTPVMLLSGAIYYGFFAWLLDRVPDSRMLLLRLWALGAVPAALVGLAVALAMNAHAGPEDFSRAMIPHGVGPNGLGTTLLQGSVIALGLALTAGAAAWERGAWLAASLVALAGIAATESRASLIGWIAGVVTLTGSLAWTRAGRRARIAAGALAAVAAAALVVAGALVSRNSELSANSLVRDAMKVSPVLVTRWVNVTHDFEANRSKVWSTSLQMVAASPWLGTGFGTFEAAYSGRITRDDSLEPFAFNLALNLAVETGLLGLYAAVWIAQAAVVEWRRWGRLPAGAADTSRPLIVAVWVGLLVDQMLDNTLFSISTSAALWLLLAMLVVPPAEAGGPVRGAVRAERPPKTAPVLLS